MAPTDLINPASHIGRYINTLLSILEKLADESLWKSFLGERLVNLGQKYFGNDFVTLSLAFYLAPILKTHWQNLVTLMYNKVAISNRVSVKIYSYNGLYNDISKYVFENCPSRGKMASGILEYSTSSQGNRINTGFYGEEFFENYGRDEKKAKDDDAESQCELEPLKVELLPPSSFVEEIEYKGHKVTVNFVEGNNEVSEHLELSMESPDTKLLHVMIEEWTNRISTQKEKGSVYRAYGTYWQHERDLPERPLDSVHLCEGQKEKLVQDMKMFKKKADWYHKRGIAHRRGYLLYGPPGTGKTSTIQAVATLLHLNVAITSLSSIASNDDLISLMSQLPANSIMVMEDIDHLFKSTSEDTTPSTLTMSGLLNVLDGMQGHEGSMIFMTCNTIEKIEPALLRPGRIDLKLKLDYAAPEQIRGTFLRFMNLDDKTSLPLEDEDRKKVEELADKFVEKIPAGHVTTAEVQSYFIDILLEANSNGWDRETVHEKLFTKIPAFLEKVDVDRTQAKNHKAEKESSTTS